MPEVEKKAFISVDPFTQIPIASALALEQPEGLINFEITKAFFCKLTCLGAYKRDRMKKYLFLFWTISLLAACSTTNDHDAADDIIGEWVWLESSGGLGGTTETPESTQKIVELKITNHSIKKFINGS